MPDNSILCNEPENVNRKHSGESSCYLLPEYPRLPRRSRARRAHRARRATTWYWYRYPERCRTRHSPIPRPCTSDPSAPSCTTGTGRRDSTPSSARATGVDTDDPVTPSRGKRRSREIPCGRRCRTDQQSRRSSTPRRARFSGLSQPTLRRRGSRDRWNAIRHRSARPCTARPRGHATRESR